MRTERWRLTERHDGTRELYDHHNDAGEYFNVIADPEHAMLLPGLHALLDAEFGPPPQRKTAGPNAGNKPNRKAEK